MFLKDTKARLDRRHQPQKIFIQGMKEVADVSQIESDFLEYFSMFGNVIDSKVLKNGYLIRPKCSVRLHNF